MKQGDIWLINLSKLSSADCFQVRSISEKRFVKKIGRISSHNLEDIQEALGKVLTISTI
jgi:mRNA interferase MazF